LKIRHLGDIKYDTVKGCCDKVSASAESGKSAESAESAESVESAKSAKPTSLMSFLYLHVEGNKSLLGED